MFVKESLSLMNNGNDIAYFSFRVPEKSPFEISTLSG
jgi:hypothetical protein